MTALYRWWLTQWYAYQLRDVTLDLMAAREEVAYLEEAYGMSPYTNQACVDDIVLWRERVVDLEDAYIRVTARLAGLAAQTPLG